MRTTAAHDGCIRGRSLRFRFGTANTAHVLCARLFKNTALALPTYRWRIYFARCTARRSIAALRRARFASPAAARTAPFAFLRTRARTHTFWFHVLPGLRTHSRTHAFYALGLPSGYHARAFIYTHGFVAHITHYTVCVAVTVCTRTPRGCTFLHTTRWVHFPRVCIRVYRCAGYYVCTLGSRT